MKYYKGALLEDGAMGVLGLVFIGMMTGAGVVGLASFQATQNSNASLGSVAGYNALGNATTGLLNLSLQLPTIGTIVAIGLMITVLVGALLGAYAFFARK